MSSAHALHLGLLGLWAGLVVSEVILELATADIAVKARVHYWIDLVAELPTLAGVLLSGAWLLRQVPLTPLLMTKIGLALVAIALNGYCAVMVILRYRASRRGEALERLDLLVRSSALGFPFGAAALYIGLRYYT